MQRTNRRAGPLSSRKESVGHVIKMEGAGEMDTPSLLGSGSRNADQAEQSAARHESRAVQRHRSLICLEYFV